MRIIGGELGGRRLNPPLKNWPTRPTTDRAKEALFNILANRLNFENLSILELFGGTGAHAFECISRGSADVTVVDKYFGCIKYIKAQSEELGISDLITIIKNDVKRFVEQTDSFYDYVFADPPYDWKWLSALPDLILSNVNLNPDFLLIIEHDNRNDFSNHPHFIECRKYGDSYFTFFEEKNS